MYDPTLATASQFDAMHDFPASLRRVKPLPKRRRTSDASDEQKPAPYMPPIPPLPPDATAEEIIAHADSLTQNYYIPILGGVQDLLRAAGVGEGDGAGDGDYFDHLQQPGNTKKRKVPANLTGSATGILGSGLSGEDGVGEGLLSDKKAGDEQQFAGHESDSGEKDPHAALYASLKRKKGRMPAVTRAGLKHKETLKGRKRQLAAVLGALSHGDTLALDQALSSNYSFDLKSSSGTSQPSPPLRIRLSKRHNHRLARAAKYATRMRHPDKIGLETCAFSFVCHSATADRLIATKEEVSMLRTRFEQELARQAAKAAKLAKSSSTSSPSKGSRTKRSARRSGNSEQTQQQQQTAQFLDSGSLLSPEQQLPLTPAAVNQKSGKNGSKKKKRSALANASNPHHLRNYVPSRLPNQGGPPPNAAAHHQKENVFGPLPLRFLAADIPPPRGTAINSHSGNVTNRAGKTIAATNPADEWICAYCEYELFYGDEHVYKRAIRKRKKILRRRQRARERAAAAASGNSVAAKAPPEKREEEYDDPGYDPTMEEYSKQNNWRADGGYRATGGGGDGASYG